MQTVPDEASFLTNKRRLGVNSGQSDDAVGVESDFFSVYQMLTGDLWMGLFHDGTGRIVGLEQAEIRSGEILACCPAMCRTL